MYVYNQLICDENTKKDKNKILRKIRYHGGLLNIYVITLAGGEDLFDIIPGYTLKQKMYPLKDLYIMGFASGYDEAVSLVTEMMQKFYEQYGSYGFKKELLANSEENFRIYGRK